MTDAEPVPDDPGTSGTPDPRPLTEPRDLTGQMHITGRLLSASNASFVADIGEGDEAPRIVYKPTRGERELWDFPTGTLALREVAAYRVSAAGGFDVVPYTCLVDGPLGPGSAQVWVEVDDEADEVVDVVEPGEIPDGWLPVMYGEDELARLVAVVHADDERLRRMAVFDALINNADRKAGHVLIGSSGLYGCDHGIAFHTDTKLRTLLWGWAGSRLTDAEAESVRRAVAATDDYADLLDEDELTALADRAARLIAVGLPKPRPSGPAVPWPLW